VPEVLSQSEIDALLSALTSGEVKAEDIRNANVTTRIRNYDFRRAMRFSKDHIRIISRIHEHFGRLFTTHLSAQLRSFVQFQVESVDQVPYEEFIRSIPTLTVIQVMEFAPLEGKVVVEMSPQIVFAMLDRVMGGDAKGPYKERELTEIEEALLGRLLSGIPQFFADAWKNVVLLEPLLLSVESNPQFLQLTTPNETVLVITLSARIGSATGLINVCIPHVTLEPILPKLSTQYFMDGSKSRHAGNLYTEKISIQMERTSLNLTVVLGETDLSLEDLLQLRVGDCIPLIAPIKEPLRVCIDNEPKFYASIGKTRNRYAIKIVDEWRGDHADDKRSQTVTGGN